MLKDSLNGINFLNKALDGSWLRNSAISNNIANVNTPGYKKEVVNFEDVLRNEMNMSGQVQMKKTNPGHIDGDSSTTIRVEKVTDTNYRVDNNNVDIDVETGELAKNTIYYNALVTELNSQFNRLKSAITLKG